MLIDVHSPEDIDALLQAREGLSDGIYEQAASMRDGDDAWITAMPHYLSLDWRPGTSIDAPTLIVRSTESMAGPAQDDTAKVTWRYAQAVDVVDVPGNHLTMLEKHATRG